MIRMWYRSLKLEERTEAVLLRATAENTLMPSTATKLLTTPPAARPAALAPVAAAPGGTAAGTLIHAAVLRTLLSNLSRLLSSRFQSSLASPYLPSLVFSSPLRLLGCNLHCFFTPTLPLLRPYGISLPTSNTIPASLPNCVFRLCATGLNIGPWYNSLCVRLQQQQKRRLHSARGLQQQNVTTLPERTLLAHTPPSCWHFPLYNFDATLQVRGVSFTVSGSAPYMSGSLNTGVFSSEPNYSKCSLSSSCMLFSKAVENVTSAAFTGGQKYDYSHWCGCSDATYTAVSCAHSAVPSPLRSYCCSYRGECTGIRDTSYLVREGKHIWRNASATEKRGMAFGSGGRVPVAWKSCKRLASHEILCNTDHAVDVSGRDGSTGKVSGLKNQNTSVFFACIACTVTALVLQQRTCKTDEQKQQQLLLLRDQTSADEGRQKAVKTCKNEGADHYSLSTAICEPQTRFTGCSTGSVDSRIQHGTHEDRVSEVASGTTERLGAASRKEAEQDSPVDAGATAPAKSVLPSPTAYNEGKGHLNSFANAAGESSLDFKEKYCSATTGTSAFELSDSRTSTKKPTGASVCSDTPNALSNAYSCRTDGGAVLQRLQQRRAREAHEKDVLQQRVTGEGREATRWAQMPSIPGRPVETALAAGKDVEHRAAAAKVMVAKDEVDAKDYFRAKTFFSSSSQAAYTSPKDSSSGLSNAARSAASSAATSAAGSVCSNGYTAAATVKEEKQLMNKPQRETETSVSAVANPSDTLAGEGGGDTDHPVSAADIPEKSMHDQFTSPGRLYTESSVAEEEEAAAAAALSHLPPSEACAALLWQRLEEERQQRLACGISESALKGRCKRPDAISYSSTSVNRYYSTSSGRASFLLAHALTLGPEWAETVLDACPEPAALEYLVCDFLEALRASPASTSSLSEKKPPLLSTWLLQPVLSLFRRRTPDTSSSPTQESAEVRGATGRANGRAEAARRAATALNAVASLLLAQASLPAKYPPVTEKGGGPSSLASSIHHLWGGCARCGPGGTEACRSVDCVRACALPWQIRSPSSAEYPFYEVTGEDPKTSWLRLLSSKWADVLLQDLYADEHSFDCSLSGQCGVLQKWLYGNLLPTAGYNSGKNGSSTRGQHNTPKDVSTGALTGDSVLQQEAATGILRLLALTVIRSIFTSHSAQQRSPQLQRQNPTQPLSLSHSPPDVRLQQPSREEIEGQLSCQGLGNGTADAYLRGQLAGLLALLPFTARHGQERQGIAGRGCSALWSSHAQILWLECVRLAAADGSLVRFLTRAPPTKSLSGASSRLRVLDPGSTFFRDNTILVSKSHVDINSHQSEKCEALGDAAVGVLHGLCLETQRLVPALPVPAAACLTELINAALCAQQQHLRALLSVAPQSLQHHGPCLTGGTSSSTHISIHQQQQEAAQHLSTVEEKTASLCCDFVPVTPDIGKGSSAAANYLRGDSVYRRDNTKQKKGNNIAKKRDSAACSSHGDDYANNDTREDATGGNGDHTLGRYSDVAPVLIATYSTTQALRLPLLPEVLFSLSVALLDTLHPSGSRASSLDKQSSSSGFWGASLLPNAVLRFFLPSTPAAASTITNAPALGAAAAAILRSSDGARTVGDLLPSPETAKAPTAAGSVLDGPDGSPITSVIAVNMDAAAIRYDEHQRRNSAEEAEMLLLVLASLLQSIIASSGLISSALHAALLPAVALSVPLKPPGNTRSPILSSDDSTTEKPSSIDGSQARGASFSPQIISSSSALLTASSSQSDAAASPTRAGAGIDSNDTGSSASKADGDTVCNSRNSRTPSVVAGVEGHSNNSVINKGVMLPSTAMTSNGAIQADSARLAALRGGTGTQTCSKSTSSGSSNSTAVPGGGATAHKAVVAAEKATAAAITSDTMQQATHWALQWLQTGRDVPNPGGMSAATEYETSAFEGTGGGAPTEIGRVLVRLSLKTAELLHGKSRQRWSPQRQLQEQYEQHTHSHMKDPSGIPNSGSMCPTQQLKSCRCSRLATEDISEPLRLALTSWMAVQGLDSPHFGAWLEELRFYALQRMHLQLLAELVERPARLAAAAFFDWDTDAIVLETLALLNSTSIGGSLSVGSSPACLPTDTTFSSGSKTSTAHTGKALSDARWLLPSWFRGSVLPDAATLATKTSSISGSTTNAAQQATSAISEKQSSLQESAAGAAGTELMLSKTDISSNKGMGVEKGEPCGDLAHQELPTAAAEVATAEEATVGTPVKAGMTAATAITTPTEVAAGDAMTFERFHVARRPAEADTDKRQQSTNMAADFLRRKVVEATLPDGTPSSLAAEPPGSDTAAATQLLNSGPSIVDSPTLKRSSISSPEECDVTVYDRSALQSTAEAPSRVAAESDEAAQLLLSIEKHAVNLETEAAVPVDSMIRAAAIKEVMENTERHEALQQLALLSCCTRTFPVKELWATGGLNILWLLARKELELLLRDPVALTLYNGRTSNRRLPAIGDGKHTGTMKAETCGATPTTGPNGAASTWLQQLRQLQWITQGVGSFWRSSNTETDQKATASAAMEALLLAVESARKEREPLWKEVHWISRIAANAAGAPQSPLTSQPDCLAAWQKLMLQVVHEVYVHPALLSPLFSAVWVQIPAVTMRLAAPSAVYYEAVRCLHNLSPQSPCGEKEDAFCGPAEAANKQEISLQREERETYLSCVYPFSVPGQPHHLIDPLLLVPPLHSPVPRILQRFKPRALYATASADTGSAHASLQSPSSFPSPSSSCTGNKRGQQAEREASSQCVSTVAIDDVDCGPCLLTSPTEVANDSSGSVYANCAATWTGDDEKGGDEISSSSSLAADSDPSSSATVASTRRTAASPVAGETSSICVDADRDDTTGERSRCVMLYRPHLPTQRLTGRQLNKLLYALQQHQKKKQLRDTLELQPDLQRRQQSPAERLQQRNANNGASPGILESPLPRSGCLRTSPGNATEASQQMVATAAQYNSHHATPAKRGNQLFTNNNVSEGEAPVFGYDAYFPGIADGDGESSLAHEENSVSTGGRTSSSNGLRVSNSNGVRVSNSSGVKATDSRGQSINPYSGEERRSSYTSEQQGASSVQLYTERKAPFVVFLHGLRGSAWRTWRCSHCGDEFVLHNDTYNASPDFNKSNHSSPNVSTLSDSSENRALHPNGKQSSSLNISTLLDSTDTSSQSDVKVGDRNNSNNSQHMNNTSVSSDIMLPSSERDVSDNSATAPQHKSESPETVFQLHARSPSEGAFAAEDYQKTSTGDALPSATSREGTLLASTSGPTSPSSAVFITTADTTSERKGDTDTTGLSVTQGGVADPSVIKPAAPATATAQERRLTTPASTSDTSSLSAPESTKSKDRPRCACYVLKDTEKQTKLEEKDYIGSTQSFYYLWPRQLLAQELPGCCILSVDYQAPLFRKPVPFCRRPLRNTPRGRTHEKVEAQEESLAAAAAGVAESAAASASPRRTEAGTGRASQVSAAAADTLSAVGGGNMHAPKSAEDTKVGIRMGLSLHPLSKASGSQEQQRTACGPFTSSSSRGREEDNKPHSSSVNNTSSDDGLINTFKRNDAAAAEEYEWDVDAWGVAGGSAEDEGPTLWQLGRCVQRQLRAAGVGQGDRPIVFVAHSMGGLIAEYLLLNDPAIRRNTRALLFFSTPHLGSPLAEREWLRMVARPLLPLYVQQLSPLDATLRSLSSSFARLIQSAAGQHIRIAAVGELRPTPLPYIGGSALVVPPWSSLPPWLRAHPAVLLDVNHSHTCKPASSTDIRYTILEELLLEILQEEGRAAMGKNSTGVEADKEHAGTLPQSSETTPTFGSAERSI